MIKRIFVGLGDARCVDSEVRQAVELAQLHNAEVTAMTLVDVNEEYPPVEEVAASIVPRGFAPMELRPGRGSWLTTAGRTLRRRRKLRSPNLRKPASPPV